MVEPWATTQSPPVLGQPGGIVTLVEGSSFLVCGRSGSIDPGGAQGLFFMDTRVLSTFHLTIDGEAPEPLDVVVDEPFVATFVSRARPARGHADAHLVVVRRRAVSGGMREELEIRNFGTDPAECVVLLETDADFADLFEVKESRVRRRGEYRQSFEADTFHYGVRRGDTERQVSVRFDQPPLSGPQQALWEVRLDPHESWRLLIEVSITIGEATVGAPRDMEATEHVEPRQRLNQWRSQAPAVTADYLPLVVASKRAIDDLGVLRIPDPEQPERSVIAAGAPWFMTLFGRDSLLTAWMALLVDPDLALGVLQTLARFQGSDVDPRTEEEPGRILHEIRFGDAGRLALGGGDVYYGTADSSPLFVMLLGELRRWGLADTEVKALLPHADRALAWIEEFGDRDGDGYVEYQRTTPQGLLHQGWKDSWDGVRFADGSHAQPPVALCEVQAYTYAAFVARAHFAEQDGDPDGARSWVDKAQDLKVRFNRDFWVDEHGWFAVGLDADKRQIDALASNMGHCLWTGIVDRDKAEAVARHLLSPEMASGWGIRTLGTSMAAYNPVSYHVGSVWPHDTALCVAGLIRYGFVHEAHQILLGLLEAASAFGGRLPELFCGFGRDEMSAPIEYPTSCSPQAWAAASPLLLVRGLLRLDPWMPHDVVWLAPELPDPIHRLRVEGIPLGDARVTVTVSDDEVDIEGLPDHVRWRHEPRQPLTGLYEELR